MSGANRNAIKVIVAVLSLLFLFGLLACDDDSSGESDGGDLDSDTGYLCENIEWSPQERYLVNGSIVSKWNLPAYKDANANGFIDPEEEIDVNLDFVDLCKSGKKSVVMMMATDD